MKTNLTTRTLNVNADAPDLRDQYYQANLIPLVKKINPPDKPYILDQGDEGACTGFALAAVIDYLYKIQGEKYKVSPWMLYLMAKRYDEWAGDDYEGSSCRGAIKGWNNTGVCSEDLFPHAASNKLKLAQLDNAMSHTMGAYYRIHPILSDMHSAINETKVLYVSANIHQAWVKPVTIDNVATIEVSDKMLGGHAFAIVGYNDKGFWVQNSWGNEWGSDGIALWLYEDWIENILDAWVVQLSLPVPQIFNLSHRAGSGSDANNISGWGSPDRSKIWKHFIHLDDGKFHNKGKYWTNISHISAIAENIKENQASIKHILFYAHGGLNSTKDSAKRIAAMKDVYLANGIYPIHFMYDTGIMEEIKDVLLGKNERVESISSGIADWFDKRIENLTRVAGRALWREMKQGAKKSFQTKKSDGSKALIKLFKTINTLDKQPNIHIVGHSTGAILHAFFLKRLFAENLISHVDSCSLLAPATTYKVFNKTYKTFLKSKQLKNMMIYNMTDELEQDDNVAYVYRKSLLYLVSNAFEEIKSTPILGMKKFNKGRDHSNVKLIYSPCTKTKSTSHGGFDNDATTMNNVLNCMLDGNVSRPFKNTDLDY